MAADEVSVANVVARAMPATAFLISAAVFSLFTTASPLIVETSVPSAGRLFYAFSPCRHRVDITFTPKPFCLSNKKYTVSTITVSARIEAGQMLQMHMKRGTKGKPYMEVDAKRAKGSSAKNVYDTLRNEILELKLGPGQLLDEMSLAERFDMSRSPIREALIRLGADGLVVTLPNRSTIVSPLEISNFPKYVEALSIAQRINTRLAAQLRRAGHQPYPGGPGQL
jgi:hypothetical protein